MPCLKTSGDEVVNALAKIKGMIPEEQREYIELKANRIIIDTSPWMRGRSYSVLIELLETAMEEHRLLHFSYSDRNLNKSVRTVEPYRLIQKAMNWYFEGFCLERQDFRFFKLSRMAGVVVTETVFAPRPFSAAPVFQPVFANAPDSVLAVLRIREAALDSFLDACAPESIEQESETTWIARVQHFDNEEGHKFLLGFGADCECLAPDDLRDHFTNYLAQVSAIYTSDSPNKNANEPPQREQIPSNLRTQVSVSP